MADLLSRPGNRRARLRALLDAGEPVLAPGAYDALTARLVEQAGFDAVYMTGFGSTASLLGRPDVGLLGQAETADNARRMAAVVDVPLIADADTGYRHPINVVRTVREYEQAGVAALHLEDQVMPKRCGHMSGKQVVPSPEMEAKIRAAVDARTDPAFVIIARTDVVQVDGADAGIERARRFADVLFVEAPSEADIEKIAGALTGRKLLFSWTAPKIRTPDAADRWTWLIIAAYTQLRLARPLAADLRRPWERPAEPGRLTPARVRRGFRHLRAKTSRPAATTKPSRPGPGRPPGSRNQHRATRHDVGKRAATAATSRTSRG